MRGGVLVSNAHSVDYGSFKKWQTSLLSFIERVFGKEGVHHKTVEQDYEVYRMFVTMGKVWSRQCLLEESDLITLRAILAVEGEV